MSETPTRTIPLKAGGDRFVDTSHAMDVAVYKLQARKPARRLKTDETLLEASACVGPVACG